MEEEKGETTQVTLRVKEQTGEEMFFKVKGTTKMQKVFDSYAQRRGVQPNAIRFMLDGQRIRSEDTSKMLELQDDDQIDVVLETVGGGLDEDENAGAAAQAEAPITLKVRDQSGEEMFFKVKKGTAMKKIMQAFADRKGVSLEVLRFTIDGTRVNAEDTPKMLEMEDGDQIDVLLQQLGGADAESGNGGAASENQAEAPITLKVRDQSGEEMFFKVKKGTAMKKIMQAFADRKGVSLEVLRFTIDGTRVNAEDTPKMLEMEDGDQIDVLLQQLGGADAESGNGGAASENQAEAPITLKVRDQSGEEMFFKVKKGTAMKKIMQAFADRKGVSLEVLRFTIDGTRVNAEDTPKMLEMEDGDQIDVLLQQLGGADAESGNGGAASENQAEAPITLKVRDQSGEEMFFKVKKGTAMKKIMQAFADRKGVSLEVLRFTIDGTRVNAEDTPKMLEMEDGDQIDVLLQQLGGADAESGNGGAASENQAEAPITLKVRDQSGEEMFFKVKKGTAMKKIMQAFADRKGVSLEVLRFTIDGTRVNAEDTPKMLEMEDGDQIDVLLQQLGGADAESGNGRRGIGEPGGAPITLKVRDQSGEEMFFKVKKGTAMKKIMQAFADRKGVSLEVLRFTIDGTRVNAEDTPKMLEMEDGDQIDVLLQQLGGADAESGNGGAASENQAEAPITLKVRDQSGEEMFFKVKKGTAMKKIMQAFADRKGVSLEVLRFTIDGTRVNAEDTPKMLEMEDGDQIDVLLQQLGGADAESGNGGAASENQAEAPITLKVRDQSGEEMFFKVKKGTAMKKIMQAFADRKGVSLEVLRFTIDGTRVNAEDTPKMLEMEDGDQIDVLLQQLGGADAESGNGGAASENQAEAPITLKVRDQSGEEMFFKVKKGTAMKKIMQAFADRKGVSLEVLRFTIDGTRVNAEDTPKMLEMEDGDQIDVLLQQLGGADAESGNGGAASENQAEAPITLKVRDQSGEEMFFKVKKGTAMKKIMQAFADRKGVSLEVLRFTIDGTRVNAEDTPKMLEMEDGDQIDVLLQQLGGADAESGNGGAASENQAEAPITLKVRDQSGEEMFFKVKKGTAMKKIMQAFADRKGVSLEVLRFTIDGTRVNAEDTPKMLEMEDGDQIDVLLQQLGGADAESGNGGAASENQAEAPITLKVRDQSGEEMFFKVKKGTAMKKIMQAFADRKGVSLEVLRFTIDGTRVNAEDTPKMLEMEDGDQIDVLLQQLGGADAESGNGGAASENQAEAPITLKVRDQSGEEMFFKVKKGTAMKKIMQAFADRKGVSLEVLRFTIDGTRVNAEDTPKMLEMEDGDQIDVLLQQLGGSSA